MKISVHTQCGVFHSIDAQTVSIEDLNAIKKGLQTIASEGDYFTMDTEGGYVVFCKEALRNSVIVVTR